jgi:hypothetical protein
VPPLHVWKTFGSEYEELSLKVTEKPSLWLTDEHDSPCPIAFPVQREVYPLLMSEPF